MDPVMADLNRHLSEQDAADLRSLRAERRLEDTDWVSEWIGEFALSQVEWQWIAALCRRVYSRENVETMLEGLRLDIQRYLEERANG